MFRHKIAPEYHEKFLEVERPQPLSDNNLERTIQEVLNGGWDHDISNNGYVDFKNEMSTWVLGSKINSLLGLNTFDNIDIINGCTQFIDNRYMQGPVQVLRGDYRYHERLGLAYVKDVGSLIPDIPLIIAMPFPSIGAPHQDMEEILHECKIKNIEVHIDGAWISCCRDINFNFDNEVIRSVGISLSKGLGLGWNRVGLRWSRSSKADAISIMNDFNMNLKAVTKIGLHFIRKFPIDYLWNTHETHYYKVCRDFNLTPTKSVYLALRHGEPVGISPLVRYLEKNNTN